MELIREHRKEGLIGATSIMIVLFLFFLFVKLGLPDPPLSAFGDGGVELNYGIDEAGYGEIQNSSADYAVQNNTPTSNQTTINTTQDNNELSSEENSITSDDPESEVIKVDKKNSPKNEIVKEANTTSNKSTTTSNTVTSTTTTNNTTSGNNGDKPNTVGDQGDKNGNPDARALYGNAGEGNNPNGSGGAGGGASLDLAGWMWDSKPTPKDETNESGRIVFQIKINSEGEIIAVNAIEKTVSPALVQFYKAHVEKLTFSKINPSVASSGVTVGKITFIIKTR